MPQLRTPQPRKAEAGDGVPDPMAQERGWQRLPAWHLPAVSSLSFATMHDLISSPMALARGGGTALPTCNREKVNAGHRLCHDTSNGTGEGFATGADLSVLVEDVPEEAICIGEALGAGTLPHAHHPVLLRVQHPTLRQQIKRNGQALDRIPSQHPALHLEEMDLMGGLFGG